jgi:Transposase DDE domain/Transposase domain (DUF772)
MNSLQQVASIFGNILQQQLFPALEEELGLLTDRMQEFVRALALVGLDGFVVVWHGPGRPPHDRSSIARALLAKAIFNLPSTRAVLDRLALDGTLRRLCGWNRASDVPDETVFSRAFAKFAANEFPQRVQQALVQRTRAQRLVGHICRDSTAIPVPEKPATKKEEEKPEAIAEARAEAAPEPGPEKNAAPQEKKKAKKKSQKKRSHKKAGTPKAVEEMGAVERQWLGNMSLEEMRAQLPRVCDVGTKLNARGRRESWVGYKLHMDVADGGIPISYELTSASLNDMVAAIPLSKTSAQRVQTCYELMDTGYDCTALREYGREHEPVSIIPYQKRGKQEAPKLERHEQIRYQERTTAERVFSRLKDQYGALNVRVRGAQKVMAHLMFGILALTADQVLRWAGLREEKAPAPS